MLEVLEFIFKDFWHWLGTLILLSAFVGGISGVFQRNHIVVNKEKDNVSDITDLDEH